MTCQRIEGSESSSQCLTDFLGSGLISEIKSGRQDGY